MCNCMISKYVWCLNDSFCFNYAETYNSNSTTWVSCRGLDTTTNTTLISIYLIWSWSQHTVSLASWLEIGKQLAWLCLKATKSIYLSKLWYVISTWWNQRKTCKSVIMASIVLGFQVLYAWPTTQSHSWFSGFTAMMRIQDVTAPSK